MNRTTILAAGLLAASLGAQAQSISITTLGVSTGTDFNTLPNTGTTAIVGGSPINGVYAVRTGNGTNLVADTGTNNGGNHYSYGAAGDPERALGSVGSGNATAGNFFHGVRFTNNTGSTITSLAVSYVGEQWRNGGNGTVNVAAFSYVTGAAVGVTLADFQAAGTAVAALDFNSPINTGGAAVLNGNLAANRVTLNQTITGLNIPNGNQILLRWSDPDQPGADHGLAIDDVFVVATGVPACVTNPVVTSTADAGAGSLRQAMLDACAGSTISFSPVTFATPQTITLTSGNLTSTVTPLTITGPGVDLLTVSGNNTSRVMIFSGQTASVSGMTLTQGNGTGSASGFGGALRSTNGALSVADLRVTASTCNTTSGGVSVSNGSLTMTRTEISGNTCGNVSALYLQDVTGTISDSLIANNSGAGASEAIRFSALASDNTLSLSNVTITGHQTTGSPMAIRVEGNTGRIGTVNLVNCTISGNSSTDAQTALGSVAIPGAVTARFVLTNSIVVGNTAAGSPADIGGTADASSSFNVIGAGGGLVNGTNNNQVGVTAAQAALGTLGNYGGATATLPLLPGSVAINTGTGTSGAPAADQRGIARVGATDIGAFESRGFTMADAGGDGQSTPINAAFAAPLAVQLSANAAIEPVAGGRVSFVPPGAGASAVLTPALATANAGGIASTTATANATTGAYTVTANAAGVTGTESFALTNLPAGAATTFQFSSATYSVGENGGTATITVTATTPPTAPITVNYATSNGSAQAGPDYTAASGTLTFGAGVGSQTFSVPITDDGVFEPDETVNLTLSLPTGGATLGTPSTAVLTIVNDDAAPTLQFSAATYSVNENGTSATITVTATPAPGATTSVNYATSDGTAVAGSDYTATSGTLIFLIGATSQTFTVPITDDAISEAGETINLALSAPSSGATLGTPNTAVLTIVDNDPPALQFSAATYSVAENGASATITVTATPAPAAAVTVNYATSNGTAVAGSDYTAASGTLTFGAGVTAQTLVVPVSNDMTVEADETVNLTLSAPTGGATLGTPSTAVLTLANDDSTAVTVSSPNAPEGNGGTTPLAFQVSLSNPVQGAVTLTYASADGNNVDPLLNATLADNDYQATTGTVSFPSDSIAAQTVNVAMVGDTDVEPDQQLRLALSNLQIPPGLNAAAFNLTNASGTGTLLNDDGATLSISSPTQAEGNAAGQLGFVVTLSAPSKTPVTVNYATANGTATAGADYTAASGTLTYTPGAALTQTVNVAISGDTTVEPNETLTVTLSAPVGATLATAIGTGTLNNDDSATLSLNAVSVSEGNAGNTPLSYTATLSAPVQGIVTATVNTADGNNADPTLNATVADNDYVAVVNGTVSIAAGLTTATTAVQIVGDLQAEPDQGLRLTLSNLQLPGDIPAGTVTLGTATGDGTILNDDLGALSVADASAPEGSLNSAPGQLRFTVSLGAPAGVPVTVDYATTGNTATSGTDFTPAAGTLSFAPGTTQQTVVVSIAPDQLNEPDETLTLTLSNPQPSAQISLLRASATGTIRNDDVVTQIPAAGTREWLALLLLTMGIGLLALRRGR